LLPELEINSCRQVYFLGDLHRNFIQSAGQDFLEGQRLPPNSHFDSSSEPVNGDLHEIPIILLPSRLKMNEVKEKTFY